MEVVGQILYFILTFAAVIALTIVFTKWIAGSKYRRASAGNLQVVESIAVGQQVYLQLVRVGSKYVIIGVTRSAVSFVCEINEDDVTLPEHKLPGDSVVIGKFEKYLKAIKEPKPPSADIDTKEQ